MESGTAIIPLLKERRFAALFGTQFLGAFNDNLFKQAILTLAVFQMAGTESEAGWVANLAAGLFILPFFLFSAPAGRLSDSIDKAKVIRIVKTFEIPIMTCGAIGLYSGHMVYLLFMLFLMGTQSAFFGPAKFAILPQHLREEELTSGNGLIEMSTFVAIILGLAAGETLVSENLKWVLATTMVGFAVLGLVIAMQIPPAPPATDAPLLPTSLQDWLKSWRSDTQDLLVHAQTTRTIWLTILAISWFWFIGAVILAQVLPFVKFNLGAEAGVATFLICTFIVGILTGAFACIKLSRGEIELGLVPIGAFAITIIGVAFTEITLPPSASPPLSLGNFLNHYGPAWPIIWSFIGLGFFASIFIIPLNALLQARAPGSQISRIIAASNFISAAFMVAAALFTMGLIKAGLSTPTIFLALFVINAVVALYVFAVLPEFFMRFVLWILASTIYRLRYEGREHIPRHGPVVLVANHVSFIDWFIITAACRRPSRFVMHYQIFQMPIVNWIFRLGKAIPIAGAKEDPDLKERAFQNIHRELEAGNVVCIFPEGGITHNGEMVGFRPGVERILAESPVPVIPMYLDGLWGSFFSRYAGRAMSGKPNFKRRDLKIRIGSPLAPTATARELEQKVRDLALRTSESGQ